MVSNFESKCRLRIGWAWRCETGWWSDTPAIIFSTFCVSDTIRALAPLWLKIISGIRRLWNQLIWYLVNRPHKLINGNKEKISSCAYFNFLEFGHLQTSFHRQNLSRDVNLEITMEGVSWYSNSQTLGQDGRGYKACGLSNERVPFKIWPPRKYVARVWIWKANLSIVWCNANVCWPQTKMTDQIWRSWIDFMICSITSPRNLSWKWASWNLAWENNWRGWPSAPGPCFFRCIYLLIQQWVRLGSNCERLIDGRCRCSIIGELERQLVSWLLEQPAVGG